MNPKVSIIVPLYNVEKYIYRCIDSILNQSYTNLEIILIDDGSPDNSGRIADDYAFFDNRIKIYHKTNGGLSDARNYGMKYVTGDYIMFVDSDDWIEPEMIKSMVNIVCTYKAEVVQSAFYYAHENYLLFDNRYFKRDNSTQVFNNKELMTALVINETVKNFAWGKLYKTSLIKDIPFKKGVLFEDVFWAHKVMQRVNTYVLVNQAFYYYFQRNDSIVASYTTKNLDIIRGLKERHQFVETYYSELIHESYKVICKAHFDHYNLLFLNRKQDPTGHYRKEIHRYIRHNYKNIKPALSNNLDLNMQLYLFTLHPLLNIGYLSVKKTLRKMKITKKSTVLEKLSV